MTAGSSRPLRCCAPQPQLLLPFYPIALPAMTIYRNPRTKDTVKVNKAMTVIWSYLFGPFFYLSIGAGGHAVAYTVLAFCSGLTTSTSWSGPCMR